MEINLRFNSYDKMYDFCRKIIGEPEKKPEETAKQDTEIISRTDERKEAKEKQKYGNNNKPKVDVGKILALHRAGWTGAKIADEMGCSTATVSHYIKESRHAGT